MERVGEFKPDNLVGGDFDIVTSEVTLQPGTYQRGAVIAKDSSGKYVLLDLAEHNADPKTHTLHGILSQDITLAAEGVATIYLTGQFCKSEVFLVGGAAVDAALIEQGRLLSIFFVDAI
ncbi:hypothetical protein [Piscirickettsia litoralis]|uniref:Head decoration protein n=1 Tax=Piscirickettsia litoralis TaxID=1891921 RepID=A0ABX2ZYH6_9GAMM|nr:hypothetical protein [Piscirickettsia litoralis]ODN41563.1 hypothetical protein BGC07_15760 [Piscirickettsia litoralis]